MISEPTQEARKEMMKVARSKKTLDNSFWIDKNTGNIKTVIYRDNGSYVTNCPKNTYEIYIHKNVWLTYEMLQDQINDIMDRLNEEEEMNQKQKEDIKELASYSDECLKGQFGFSDQRIREIRDYSSIL